jgi:hypothetical protein
MCVCVWACVGGGTRGRGAVREKTALYKEGGKRMQMLRNGTEMEREGGAWRGKVG